MVLTLTEGNRDNRQAPRFSVSWEIKVIRSNNESHTARADNISILGAHTTFHCNMKKGEPVLLKMRPLIDGKHFNLQTVAKVVPTRLLPDKLGFRVGLVFYKPSEAFLCVLRKMVY